MSETTTAEASTRHTALPGRAVLRASRNLLIACVAVGILYSIVTTGSRGGIVAIGSRQQMSVTMTLHPSPVVYVAIAAVYFIAFHVALERTTGEAHALRVFTRAAAIVVLIGLGSVLIADLWFFLTPLGGWPTPAHWPAPFPFGAEEVSTSMSQR